MLTHAVRWLVASLFVLLLGGTLAPGAADAGVMRVYSCHTPSGRVVATHGWAQVGATLRTQAIDDCASGPGGELYAQLASGEQQPGGAHVSWRFAAAPDTVVISFDAAVCAHVPVMFSAAAITWPGDGINYDEHVVVANQAGAANTLGCFGGLPFWLDARNRVSRSGLATPALWFSAWCLASACPEQGGYTAKMEIAAFQALVLDQTPVAVSGVSGRLATHATHSGTEVVRFDAQDRGVGVYRAVAEVKVRGAGEWREISTAHIGNTAASCQPVGETAERYEFASPQPCPLTVAGASLALDTAQLPAGDHMLRVVVEDAAGNRSDVIPARLFPVTSPADATPSSARLLDPTNGVGASRTALVKVNGSTTRRIRAGRRVTFSGRLLDAQAQPIAGATLEVHARTVIPKTKQAQGDWRLIGQVVTTKSGSFKARLPAGASRSVLVVYKANPADPGWTSTAPLTVIVSARPTLRVKRSRVRNRRSAVFTGKVRKAGVLITLQVAQGSKWIPVATTRQRVRSGRRGRFRLSYRFQRTTRRATFRFRVVAIADSAFAYDEGYSKTVKVHVRP